MATPPDLDIPSSQSTVSVRIIDTTSHIWDIALGPFLSPSHIGAFKTLSCPAFSFLVEHPSGRKLLFDLGVRRDFQNLSPLIKERIGKWGVSVMKGVREQLEDHGVDGKDIEAVIWSHFHWDHTGDPFTFEKETALIVGPGFKDAILPGYPAAKMSPILESDYEGRELREISFDQGLKIGHFKAFDYFGDGSFYLLDSPGHTIGHICALARVTSSPNTFIFMGGDACHHGGEFRPSQYLPLPSSISPNPLDLGSVSPCPGAIFEGILRDSDKTKPIFEVAKGEGAVAYDAGEAERTIQKVIEVDANDQVLVVMAHDDSLLGVVDFFPKYANDFKEKGWVKEGRWLFLKDFISAVQH